MHRGSTPLPTRRTPVLSGREAFTLLELLLVLVFQVGPIVAWTWCLIYITIIGLGFGLRFKSGRWKSIDILDRRTPIEDIRIPVEH